MKADSRFFMLAVGLVWACSRPAAPREPIAAIPATSAPLESHDTDSDDYGAMAPSVPPLPPVAPPPATPSRAGGELRKELVLGSDGKPLGEAEPVRYTTGSSTCPPPDGATCPVGKNESCEVHERVTCQSECHGYRTQHYTCENDGTNTSLCECWRDRQEQNIGGNPFSGEGPDACFAAAAECVKAR